jgi:hypothetical protein
MSVSEFLNNLTGAQEQCNLSEQEFLTRMLYSSTGLAHDCDDSPTEPRTTEPRTTEPRTTEPRTTEPRTTEPRTTEPRTTKPRKTQPRMD